MAGNFAPLKKAIAAEQGGIKSRLAGIAKAGALVGVGIGVAAAKASVDFTHAMTLVQTQAGASDKEIRRMTDGILAFAASGRTVSTPKELADALFRVESAGIRGSKALETLKRSSDLAELGQADLEDTTKALVAAQKTGIKGSENLKKTIGTLNAVVGSGQLKLEDLVGALGTGFLATSRAAGLTLTDVGGSLAEITKQGTGARQAATRLRMIFSLMAAPTDSAQKALASIGLGQFDLAKEMRGPDGILGALELLKAHMADLSKEKQLDIVRQAFGGARSGGTLLQLLQNTDDLDKTLQHIRDHAGDVDKSLQDVRADPAVQLKEAWVQLNTVLVKLGGTIAPAAVGAISDLTKIITDPKLTSDEKISEIADMASNAFTDLAPKAGALGVQIGVDLVKGIVKGFFSTDLIGKIFIAGALIRLIGGKGKLTALGAAIARPVTTGYATGMQTGIAAGTTRAATQAAIGSKATAAMAAQGRTLGTATTAGMSGGIVAGTRSARFVRGFRGALGGLGSVAKGLGVTMLAFGLIGGATEAFQRRNVPGMSGFHEAFNDFFHGFLGTFGISLGQSTAEMFSEGFKAELTAQTRDLGGTITDSVSGATISPQLGRKVLKGMELQFTPRRARDVFARFWDGMTPEERQLTGPITKAINVAGRLFANQKIKLPADLLQTDPQTAIKLGKQLDDGLKFLRNRTGASLGDIQKVVGENVRAIDQTLGKGTDRGRAALAENFRLAARNVATMMEKSGHVTKEGMDRIESLIRRADLIDPSRKQARAFGREWAKGMDRSHEITKKGVQKMLDDLGKMPPKARDIAARTALNQLEQARRGGQITGREYDKIRSKILSTFTDVQVGASVKTGRMVKQVVSNVFQMVGAVTSGESLLGKNTNKALKAFGVKALDFTLHQPGKAGALLGGLVGALKGQKGLAFDVPDVGPMGDRHHVHLLLERGERGFVLNRTATAEMDRLKEVNRRIPRREGGVFDRTGVQHLARGGMAAMIAEASRFERHHFPYRWGGGHGSFGIQPVDCSGAVSDVLHAAGLLNAPMVSGALAHWGKPGTGPLTVYANPTHTFMSLAGRYFGTSSSNPRGGAGWIDSGFDRGYLSGFAARTMDVTGAAAATLKRIILRGPRGPLRSEGQSALDKVRRAGNKFIQSKMPAGQFGGGQALADFAKGPGKVVGASVYGFGEPGTGTVGASGVSLPGKPAFAELDMGTALGHLPFGAKLRITVGGRTAMGEKLDIGAGGGDVAGHHRAIDFWRDLAQRLGLSGSFLGLAKVQGRREGGLVAPYVGSFADGGSVRETGFGFLHAGEEVVESLQHGGVLHGAGARFRHEARLMARLIAGLEKRLSTNLPRILQARLHHIAGLDPEDRSKRQERVLRHLRQLGQTHDALSRSERRELRRLRDGLLPHKAAARLRHIGGLEDPTKAQEKQARELRQKRQDNRVRLRELEHQAALHQREQRERRRLEDRIADLEAREAESKELTSELKALRSDLKRRDRALEGLSVNERAIIRFLANRTGSQQGTQASQKRRNAGIGKATSI